MNTKDPYFNQDAPISMIGTHNQATPTTATTITIPPTANGVFLQVTSGDVYVNFSTKGVLTDADATSFVLLPTDFPIWFPLPAHSQLSLLEKTGSSVINYQFARY